MIIMPSGSRGLTLSRVFYSEGEGANSREAYINRSVGKNIRNINLFFS